MDQYPFSSIWTGKVAPDIDKIYQQAMVSIDSAVSSEELEKIRIEYLGKKGKITNLLKSLGVLPPEQRPLVGGPPPGSREA